MARKAYFAVINPDSLKSVGSRVLPELNNLNYFGNSGYLVGKGYYIRGKKRVQIFVKSMLSHIDECERLFTDSESREECRQDRELLKQLLRNKSI
jgi:hypothetical protein